MNTENSNVTIAEPGYVTMRGPKPRAVASLVIIVDPGFYIHGDQLAGDLHPFDWFNVRNREPLQNGVRLTLELDSRNRWRFTASKSWQGEELPDEDAAIAALDVDTTTGAILNAAWTLADMFFEQREERIARTKADEIFALVHEEAIEAALDACRYRQRLAALNAELSEDYELAARVAYKGVGDSYDAGLVDRRVMELIEAGAQEFADRVRSQLARPRRNGPSQISARFADEAAELATLHRGARRDGSS